jgi:RNA polymerase sigma-70 factor (ECF subfamily)
VAGPGVEGESKFVRFQSILDESLAIYEKMTPRMAGSNIEQMSGEQRPGPGSLPTETAIENERLVGAILQGDREAEREFAQRFMRPVKAMLLARSRDPDLAADLQQDVMIEAICALRRGQLREPQKLAAFVSAIARNVMNNHFRGAVRRPESIELPDNLPDLSVPGLHEQELEREALALKAIDSLEMLDRTILQMTLVDGLKPGVIAEKLRLNPDVVRQRKLRATRRLIDFVRRQSQTGFSSHLITEQTR